MSLQMLASIYKQRPTLRGEGTSNIILEPVFPIPLENVAPFFLHNFLGLFCRSVDSFKKDLRGIDRRIVDPENRNPVTFEILEGKLEQLTLQLLNTRESVDNSKREESVLKERIADIATILDPIHSSWRRADAVRTLERKNILAAEELLEFRGHRESALELLSELEVKHKETLQKEKQVTESEHKVKTIRLEIKNIQGPLEKRAVEALEFQLGLRGNIWWGDYIGPDMMAFLIPPLNANQKTRFEKLIDIIKAEMLEHMNLLATREAQPSDTLRDIHKLTQDYKNMWQVFQEFLLLVKTQGYIDDKHLCKIEECHPRFCVTYESVVKPGKEPPPKFHCVHSHMIDFIRRNRCTWVLSEEGLESSHHILRILGERNARRKGVEEKFKGTMASFLASKDAGFEASLEHAIHCGKRKKMLSK